MRFSRRPKPYEMDQAGMALQVMDAEGFRFDILSLMDHTVEAGKPATRERDIPANVAHESIVLLLARMEEKLDSFISLSGIQGVPLAIEKRVRELRIWIHETKVAVMMTNPGNGRNSSAS